MGRRSASALRARRCHGSARIPLHVRQLRSLPPHLLLRPLPAPRQGLAVRVADVHMRRVRVGKIRHRHDCPGETHEVARHILELLLAHRVSELGDSLWRVHEFSHFHRLCAEAGRFLLLPAPRSTVGTTLVGAGALATADGNQLSIVAHHFGAVLVERSMGGHGSGGVPLHIGFPTVSERRRNTHHGLQISIPVEVPQGREEGMRVRSCHSLKEALPRP
mmetsp:Transcript_3840/g.10603  ORF Transcript_3840/g.10603 Transcript_3840/m.10603 type:complete len:219 (-) Transcript_3840:1140-1796(-)